MTEFILNKSGGLLSEEVIETGNTQKYRLDGQFLLDFGVIWTDTAVGITDGVDASVANATISDDCKSMWFFVTAPTEGEKFTVTVTNEASDGQTLVYTLDYLVVT